MMCWCVCIGVDYVVLGGVCGSVSGGGGDVI
jgi:hypothetical protein